jgi:probable rRNA maturation factor
MPVDVSRRARGAPPLSSARVRALASRMLEVLGLADAELSVLLTDDATIRELNRTHRGKDAPTDVLAFSQDERAAHHAHVTATGGRELLLGDVVISLDTAARQARSRRRDLWSEVRFLLAHGVLHLIGYDHGNAKDKREMSALTRRVVARASAPGSLGQPAKPRAGRR